MTRKFFAVAVLCGVMACTGTAVQHQAVPQTHTMEYFSFSSVEVQHLPSLPHEQASLISRYHPGEAVADRIRVWAEETGMWGGEQSIVLEVESVRLPARWETEQHGPFAVGSGVGYRGEDHLRVDTEVRQGARTLHRLEVTRTLGTLDRSLGQAYSSDRAMNALIEAVAWQVVYELTPPGYDEAIILAGHRDGVEAATVVASKRGLLSLAELMKSAVKGDLKFGDIYCADALAKPSWLPAWIWMFPDPTFGFGYRKCQERAAEAAKRR